MRSGGLRLGGRCQSCGGTVTQRCSAVARSASTFSLIPFPDARGSACSQLPRDSCCNPISAATPMKTLLPLILFLGLILGAGFETVSLFLNGCARRRGRRGHIKGRGGGGGDEGHGGKHQRTQRSASSRLLNMIAEPISSSLGHARRNLHGKGCINRLVCMSRHVTSRHASYMLHCLH